MLFEENMRLLELHQPEVAEVLRTTPPCGEVVTARSGLPTLKVPGPGGRDIHLHSAYDPWAEAARLTESFRLLPGDIMLVLGVGLGYHVFELARRCPKVNIIAIDPHPGFFRHAMETLDLSLYLNEDGPVFLFSEDPLKIGELVTKQVDLVARTHVKTYVYPPVARLYPEKLADQQQGVFEGLVQSILVRNTSLYFARSWTENLLRNLEATWRAQGINALTAAFPRVPAIIVSAGPSLDKNMHLLAEIRDKAVTLAAGTAFKPLLKAGLKPDMVVSIDGGEANARNFSDVEENETALVFDAVTHRDIPQHFLGPRFAGCGYPHFSLFLDTVLGLDKGYFPVTGYSVAMTCLGLALSMGCDPIVFIGQDLSFAGGRSHVSGSIYEETDQEKRVEKLYEVDGNYGEKVLTNMVFMSMLRNLEGTIAVVEGGRTFINATEGGARIRGTQVLSLRQAIDRYMTKDEGVRYRIRAIFDSHDPARDYDNLLDRLRDIDSDLQELGSIAGEAVGLSRRLAKLYAYGLPAAKPLEKIKKGFTRADGRLLKKWQANLLLQRAAYPVHVQTFADNVDRHEELGERERGQMVAAQSETFYHGLKETIESTEIMLRETISQLEKISS